MSGELRYRIDDPRWTGHHRAALGGLAATVLSWGGAPPDGITASCDASEVSLSWGDDLTDQAALRKILEASFQIKDGLVDLPGQRIPKESVALRIANHNALMMTFLQHNSTRKTEPEPRVVSVQEDGVRLGTISHKVMTSYAHQCAYGTGLLDAPKKTSGAPVGSFPLAAAITQAMIPGATHGMRPLEASPSEAILLLYLIVGAAVFLLRPRTQRERAQAGVIVPEVRDLLLFAGALGSMQSGSEQSRSIASASFMGRLVGGLEEAALRFLLDLNACNANIAAVQAFAMGKVAWDGNQLNRSMRVRLQRTYPEIGVYLVAQEQLGRARVIPTRTGSVFAVPCSPLPELIAANFGDDMHWCHGFRKLVQYKRDFEEFLYTRKELNAMAMAIKDPYDQALVTTFQEAWRYRQGRLGERAREEGADFGRLIETDRERIRNGILRCKTSNALAAWFLRFCADATKGAVLPTAQERAVELQRFIFDRRNAERFQNLMLFALVSYAGKDKTDNKSSTPLENPVT